MVNLLTLQRPSILFFKYFGTLMTSHYKKMKFAITHGVFLNLKLRLNKIFGFFFVTVYV